MFKLIRRVICIAVILAIITMGLAFWRGGERLLWFGKKAEETGKAVREKTEEFVKEADKTKKEAEDIKKRIEEITR